MLVLPLLGWLVGFTHADHGDPASLDFFKDTPSGVQLESSRVLPQGSVLRMQADDNHDECGIAACEWEFDHGFGSQTATGIGPQFVSITFNTTGVFNQTARYRLVAGGTFSSWVLPETFTIVPSIVAEFLSTQTVATVGMEIAFNVSAEGGTLPYDFHLFYGINPVAGELREVLNIIGSSTTATTMLWTVESFVLENGTTSNVPNLQVNHATGVASLFASADSPLTINPRPVGNLSVALTTVSAGVPVPMSVTNFALGSAPDSPFTATLWTVEWFVRVAGGAVFDRTIPSDSTSGEDVNRNYIFDNAAVGPVARTFDVVATVVDAIGGKSEELVHTIVVNPTHIPTLAVTPNETNVDLPVTAEVSVSNGGTPPFSYVFRVLDAARSEIDTVGATSTPTARTATSSYTFSTSQLTGGDTSDFYLEVVVTDSHGVVAREESRLVRINAALVAAPAFSTSPPVSEGVPVAFAVNRLGGTPPYTESARLLRGGIVIAVDPVSPFTFDASHLPTSADGVFVLEYSVTDTAGVTVTVNSSAVIVYHALVGSVSFSAGTVMAYESVDVLISVAGGASAGPNFNLVIELVDDGASVIATIPRTITALSTTMSYSFDNSLVARNYTATLSITDTITGLTDRDPGTALITGGPVLVTPNHPVGTVAFTPNVTTAGETVDFTVSGVSGGDSSSYKYVFQILNAASSTVVYQHPQVVTAATTETVSFAIDASSLTGGVQTEFRVAVEIKDARDFPTSSEVVAAGLLRVNPTMSVGAFALSAAALTAGQPLGASGNVGGGTPPFSWLLTIVDPRGDVVASAVGAGSSVDLASVVPVEVLNGTNNATVVATLTVTDAVGASTSAFAPVEVYQAAVPSTVDISPTSIAETGELTLAFGGLPGAPGDSEYAWSFVNNDTGDVVWKNGTVASGVPLSIPFVFPAANAVPTPHGVFLTITDPNGAQTTTSVPVTLLAYPRPSVGSVSVVPTDASLDGSGVATVFGVAGGVDTLNFTYTVQVVDATSGAVLYDVVKDLEAPPGNFSVVVPWDVATLGLTSAPVKVSVVASRGGDSAPILSDAVTLNPPPTVVDNSTTFFGVPVVPPPVVGVKYNLSAPNVAGGTAPFTYTWTIINSTGHVVRALPPFTSDEQGTITFQDADVAAGPIRLVVATTDASSASTPLLTGQPFSITPGTSIGSVSTSKPITAGVPLRVTVANVTGGTSPFRVFVVLNASNGNVTSFPPQEINGTGGTYFFNIPASLATGNGTVTVTVVGAQGSASKPYVGTILVNPPLLVSDLVWAPLPDTITILEDLPLLLTGLGGGSAPYTATWVFFSSATGATRRSVFTGGPEIARRSVETYTDSAEASYVFGEGDLADGQATVIVATLDIADVGGATHSLEAQNFTLTPEAAGTGPFEYQAPPSRGDDNDDLDWWEILLIILAILICCIICCIILFIILNMNKEDQDKDIEDDQDVTPAPATATATEATPVAEPAAPLICPEDVDVSKLDPTHLSDTERLEPDLMNSNPSETPLLEIEARRQVVALKNEDKRVGATDLEGPKLYNATPRRVVMTDDDEGGMDFQANTLEFERSRSQLLSPSRSMVRSRSALAHEGLMSHRDQRALSRAASPYGGQPHRPAPRYGDLD